MNDYYGNIKDYYDDNTKDYNGNIKDYYSNIKDYSCNMNGPLHYHYGSNNRGIDKTAPLYISPL